MCENRLLENGTAFTGGGAVNMSFLCPLMCMCQIKSLLDFTKTYQIFCSFASFHVISSSLCFVNVDSVAACDRLGVSAR